MLNNDEVPDGNSTYPVISSGFLRWGPALTVTDLGFKAFYNSISFLIMALTPSYISYTRSVIDLPNLLIFEISKIPSLVSVCSPCAPLICTWYLSAIA